METRLRFEQLLLDELELLSESLLLLELELELSQLPPCKDDNG